MSTSARIDITVSDPAATLKTKLNVQSPSQSFQNLAKIFSDIGSGVLSGSANIGVSGTKAAGSFLFSSFADTDTIEINGVTLTGVASNPGTNEFLIGATDEETANNAMQAINASESGDVKATVSASRIGGVQLSASFANNDTITINGVVFTGKTTPDTSVVTEFGVSSNPLIAETNLMNAIVRASSLNSVIGTLSFSIVNTGRGNYRLDISSKNPLTLAASANATITSTTVVITATTPGSLGNLIVLDLPSGGAATLPTGGTEGTTYFISHGIAR